MPLRLLGYGLVVGAVAIAAVVFYRNSKESEMPLLYSPQQVLSALWGQYKINDLEPGTYRTLDKERGNVTTSEGQSYTMLRAVWMGDKPIFDAEWQWTKSNLARPNDHLFAWIFGKQANGTWGVLTAENGQNSATDADTNIALSLIFAYARWQDPAYLSAARAIVGDIWNEEVLPMNGRAFVLADNIEKTSTSRTALINPSYLEPAAYRIFAKVDPAHPWMQAVDGTYAVISAATTLPLGATSANLPADWIAMDKTTGQFSAPLSPGTDSNFGYDALRVPWNLALDSQWFHDARDTSAAKQFSRLAALWEADGKLNASYSHAGKTLANYDYETPAMYGGAIGYFLLADPSNAGDVYQQKLGYLFTPDWSGWRQPLSYYDDNWAWFGIGLYSGLLPDLTAGLPPSFFAVGSSVNP